MLARPPVLFRPRLLVAGLVAVALAPSASRAAWPPGAGATPTEVVESLHREVRRAALHDADAGRRAWAWRALKALHDPGVPTLVATGLTDPAPIVRTEAVRTLHDRLAGDSPDAAAGRRAVARALRDDSITVRLAASELVRYPADGLAWSGLGIGAALGDENRFVRGAVWNALHARPADHEELIVGLVAAAESESVEARRFAWEYLDFLERLATGTDKPAGVCEALGPTLTVGLTSRDVVIRQYAVQLSSRDAASAVRRGLGDRDPAARAHALIHRLSGVKELPSPALTHLLEQALQDESPRVASAVPESLRWLTAPLRLDPTTLAALADSDEAERAAAAFELLRRQEASDLTPEQQLVSAIHLVDRFVDAAPGSLERRRLVGRFAPLLKTGGWMKRASQGDKVQREAWDRVNAAVASHSAAALDDRDPTVRRLATAALATFAVVESWGKYTCERTWLVDQGDPRRRQLLAAFSRLFEQSDDPDPAVRRAIAECLRHLDYIDLQDESFAARADEAARRLHVDADRATALLATQYYAVHWDAGAVPTLLARLAEPPATADSPDADEINQARATALHLLTYHVPASVPTERLLESAASHLPSFQALLDRDGLELLLKQAEAQFPDDATIASMIQYSNNSKWDAADVEQAFAFIESRPPEQMELMRPVLDGLATQDRVRQAERVHRWLVDRARRPALAYLALETYASDGSSALVDILNGDDPLAAALVLGALSNSYRKPLVEVDFTRLSPQAQAIVAEGARRAAPQPSRNTVP